MHDYTYYKNRLAQFSFPYACLDKALLYDNIHINLKRAHSKTIRIASKSIRCIEVMRCILDSNTQFEGIMTYHAAETVFLSQNGFNNLLLAYPVVDDTLITSIGYEIKKGKQIYLMVNSVTHVAIIETIGKKLNVIFPICIDIDLSNTYPGLHFGVWRSNITSLTSLETFLTHLKSYPHVRVEGLMGYEAQIAGLADRVPNKALKNNVIRLLKKRALKKSKTFRSNAVQLITSYGYHLTFVNGGGTGSLETTSKEPCVTEVTVGSGFYNPHLFDYYTNFKLKPALFYGVQIVRRPHKNIYTCHGGGFIASGATERIKAPVVHLPLHGQLDTNEGAGEVQTPIRFKHLTHELKIGDPIYLRHAKAGELCEHFNTILYLDKDTIREFKTYRGMNMSFG